MKQVSEKATRVYEMTRQEIIDLIVQQFPEEARSTAMVEFEYHDWTDDYLAGATITITEDRTLS